MSDVSWLFAGLALGGVVLLYLSLTENSAEVNRQLKQETSVQADATVETNEIQNSEARGSSEDAELLRQRIGRSPFAQLSADERDLIKQYMMETAKDPSRAKRVNFAVEVVFVIFVCLVIFAALQTSFGQSAWQMVTRALKQSF
eukprot:GILK01006533.1.p1 GENE.GILK01006533.1~~GILK01006533.1.p1  ORF type:complete len:154 (-),score=23.15 GILK01006533.1:122-553(-)